ncbi:WcaF family extracellular polysaccharide biosynthesis acetyltransferase [Rubellimicrobium aerolatum]|uniref:WcaF family extracellular polysaccharide biosynthesis acetyltransferase n=1 Tax=Rubellimicrobium aerolatum TaxID=490979 RepID=A0ABW0S981_9RHOB|nr:WcaF family extracellular polysaccharide biosynthesis acetyltransferase [Rubellimicrobium aerolatum]MBP1804842.1 putative colanic acid biosynthesis acetyltransferase WcaF [Rubellimicrobium aerolatum]
MRLDLYDASGFQRGAPRWKEALWLVLDGALVSSWLPGSGWRTRLLRLFGARIGAGVVIKPGVHVKFPWRLAIGAHCWIGERVWIDNLAPVIIGDHACLSQGAYLCTGSHDWSRERFDLVTTPIAIGDHAWICAGASLAPGAVLEEGAVLGMASLGRGRLPAWTLSAGVPARPVSPRVRPSARQAGP